MILKTQSIERTILLVSWTLLANLPATALAVGIWETSTLSSPGSVRFQTNIDPGSLYCLSCHDEGLDAIKISVNPGGQLMHDRGAYGHPVGIRYDVAISSSAGGWQSFRSLAEVSARVPLPDGKVSCISCHDSHSAETSAVTHGALVMSNDGSKLCFACHRI